MTVDLSKYKVMSRRQTALLIGGILIVGLVVCLISLEWVNVYFD